MESKQEGTNLLVSGKCLAPYPSQELTMKPMPIIWSSGELPSHMMRGGKGYYLLGQADNETSDLRMRTFGLVDGDGHGEEANCPAGDDTAHENHGQIASGGLEDRADCTDQSAHLDGLLTSKSVHGETVKEFAVRIALSI